MNEVACRHSIRGNTLNGRIWQTLSRGYLALMPQSSPPHQLHQWIQSATPDGSLRTKINLLDRSSYKASTSVFGFNLSK